MEQAIPLVAAFRFGALSIYFALGEGRENKPVASVSPRNRLRLCPCPEEQVPFAGSGRALGQRELLDSSEKGEKKRAGRGRTAS